MNNATAAPPLLFLNKSTNFGANFCIEIRPKFHISIVEMKFQNLDFDFDNRESSLEADFSLCFDFENEKSSARFFSKWRRKGGGPRQLTAPK